jgi:protease IV
MQRTPVSLAPSTADYIVDRRKLRRQVRFWRIVAFAIAALIIVGLGARFAGLGRLTSQPHIARLAITGLITGDAETLKLIRDIAKSKAAAAVLTIDSPGGTTAGSEIVYDELRLLSAKKPVVAVVGNMAASGAYVAALGADRIFARGNSLVGSIGVLVEFPNLSGLLDKIGVKLESIKSSPLKASPNGLEPTSEAARAAMAALVSDSFDWFKGLVKDRRRLSDDELAAVSDGRIFTGRQGLPLKLVDAIGGEREAIAWLEKEKGVAKDLPVRDWKPANSFGGLNILGSAAMLAGFAGLDNLAEALRHGGLAGGSESPGGLMSVWRAPVGE